VLLLVGCSSSEGPATSAPLPAPAGLKPTSCRLDLRLPEGAARSCGVVRVPVSRQGGAQGTLDLYVEQVRRGGGGRPPVVYLTGGPGIGLGPYAALGVFDKLLTAIDGEVLLLEQRGNTFSPGALLCEPQEALTGCFARLSAAGSTPEAYNSVEAADDVIAVLDALGHARASLWGHSYGSGLAQYVVARHPTRVASLVLEGVSEPTTPRGEDPLSTRVAALDAFGSWFSARCKADDGCANDYPQGLRPAEDLQALISTFEADPQAAVKLDAETSLEQQELFEWFINGMATHDGMLAFAQLLHAATRREADPSLMSSWLGRVGAGDVGRGAALVKGFSVALQGASTPATNATKSCFDLQSFGRDEDCSNLATGAYPASLFKLSFQSTLPTLLLNGALDTQVLSQETALVKPRFPGAKLVTLPECIGHFIFRDGGVCADELVAGFLSSGEAPSPASCEVPALCAGLPLVPRLAPP
jgi:pimeloyl-ACP methyl ester carboxylesterase